MGMLKTGKREVEVEYDFIHNKIIVTPLLEDEEGVMCNENTIK